MPIEKLPLPPVGDDDAWDRSADVAQLCALATRLFDEVQKLAPGLKEDLDSARNIVALADKSAQTGKEDAYFYACSRIGDLMRDFGHIGLIRSVK
jgi:hypothetical protein